MMGSSNVLEGALRARIEMPPQAAQAPAVLPPIDYEAICEASTDLEDFKCRLNCELNHYDAHVDRPALGTWMQAFRHYRPRP